MSSYFRSFKKVCIGCECVCVNINPIRTYSLLFNHLPEYSSVAEPLRHKNVLFSNVICQGAAVCSDVWSLYTQLGFFRGKRPQLISRLTLRSTAEVKHTVFGRISLNHVKLSSRQSRQIITPSLLTTRYWKQ